jgi:hypothetical protein
LAAALAAVVTKKEATMPLTEGQEWTDGWFTYIAYQKNDGRMVVRDPEGFDYSEEGWTYIMTDDDPSAREDLKVVDNGSMTVAEVVARYEEAQGRPLPR